MNNFILLFYRCTVVQSRPLAHCHCCSDILSLTVIIFNSKNNALKRSSVLCALPVCVSVVIKSCVSDVLEELGILGLLPVEQILQVINEGSLPQDPPLSQNYAETHRKSLSTCKMSDLTTQQIKSLYLLALTVEVVWVGQTLNKLQLWLEPVPGLLLCSKKHNTAFQC